jgi:hypothetical protein
MYRRNKIIRENCASNRLPKPWKRGLISESEERNITEMLTADNLF